MAQPERHENDPRYPYLKLAQDIVMFPEAYGYTVTHLVPSPNIHYNLVGFLATYSSPRSDSPDITLLRLHTDTYGTTTLCTQLMALNGKPQVLARLEEDSSKTNDTFAKKAQYNRGTDNTMGQPNAIMAFYAATEQLSDIPLEIALITPSDADKLESYDRLLRLSYGILDKVLPANSHNQ